MKSEFDNLLRQKIEEEELPFNPLQWQQMGSMLDAAETKRPKIITPLLKGLAAGVAILIGVAGFYFYNSDSQTTVQEGTSPEKITAFKTNTVTASNKKKVTSVSQNHKSFTLIRPGKNKGNKEAEQAQNNERQDDEMTLAEQIANSAKHSKSLLASYVSSLPFDEAETKDNVLVRSADHRTVDNLPLPAEMPEAIKIKDLQNKGAIFSLSGGLNYGNQNAGFALGVNARKKINRKIFLEGDIGLVNSRSNSLDKSLPQPPTTGPSMPSAVNGVAANISASTINVKLPNNFYYVQFTPSIGYSFTGWLNGSVGADLQQRVNKTTGETKMAIATDGSFNSFPDRDFGITGKTEFAITPRIKTGLLYRAGVNNLVYDKTYLNRRYFQVQLKYQLFGR